MRIIKWISLLVFFFLLLTLLACGSPDSISSLDELESVDFILRAVSLPTDYNHLAVCKNYYTDMRNQYMEFVEFQDKGIDLVPEEEVVGYKIKYKSDEEEVIGFICAPGDYLEKAYPVLIFNRGGWFEEYKNEPFRIQFFARFGFIVLATQYRGVDGGTGVDEFGGADVNDVVKLVDLADMFTFTNGKIYMFGWSRGAMQTYITLSRDGRIDAAVCGAGPTDLWSFYSGQKGIEVQLRQMVGNPYLVPEEYEARSAVKWPDKINTPLWIVHGTEDRRVLFCHSQNLYDAMTELGKDVNLTLYPDLDHFIPFDAFLGDYLYWLKQY